MIISELKVKQLNMCLPFFFIPAMIHHSDKFHVPQNHADHDDRQYYLDKGIVKKKALQEKMLEKKKVSLDLAGPFKIAFY